MIQTIPGSICMTWLLLKVDTFINHVRDYLVWLSCSFSLSFKCLITLRKYLRQSLHHKCNNPICNTKTTAHHNRFALIKERLLHLKHNSNGSSNLQVNLWVQLFRSILLLYNICPPKNQGKPTADYMLLIYQRT